MCDFTTWAQFIITCTHDEGGWLSLLVREIYRGVSTYWGILVVIGLLWLVQAITFGLRWRMPDSSPLQIGRIVGEDLENENTRNVWTDYRFWAFIISSLIGLAWIGIFVSYATPERLFRSIGVVGSISQLSPSGMSLVRYYVGVWWGCGMVWWVVSALCLYIIWEDPYRYRRYRLVLVHENDTDDVRRCDGAKLKKGDTSKFMYNSVYFSSKGNRWCEKKEDGHPIELTRQLHKVDGKWVLEAKGTNDDEEEVPVLNHTCQSFVRIKNGETFLVGESRIKFKISE